MSSAILTATDVEKTFGGVHAVDHASLTVEAGSITSLIGPNGAGKTTLFNVMSGVESIEGGRVELDGVEITGFAPHRIAALGMTRTFQSAKVISRMSVIDNVLLAAQGNPGEQLSGLLRRRSVRVFDREANEQAMSLLELVGLARLSREYAGNLSGGQRKLLDLARALMVRPRVLLLDEPFAGVNQSLRRDITDVLRGVRAEQGTTFLLVEHDLATVMAVSDTVFVMAQGKMIFEGPPSGVLEDQRVIDAYLGTRRGRRRHDSQ